MQILSRFHCLCSFIRYTFSKLAHPNLYLHLKNQILSTFYCLYTLEIYILLSYKPTLVCTIIQRLSRFLLPLIIKKYTFVTLTHPKMYFFETKLKLYQAFTAFDHWKDKDTHISYIAIGNKSIKQITWSYSSNDWKKKLQLIQSDYSTVVPICSLTSLNKHYLTYLTHPKRPFLASPFPIKVYHINLSIQLEDIFLYLHLTRSKAI